MQTVAIPQITERLEKLPTDKLIVVYDFVSYLLERETARVLSGEFSEAFQMTHPIPVAWSLVAPGAGGQFTPSVLTCLKRIEPSLSLSTSQTRIVGLTFEGGFENEVHHLP